MRTARFENKHVLITGRGIGFEIAKQFAAEGAILSLFDYIMDNLQITKSEIGKTAKVVNTYLVDVSNKKGVFEVVAKAETVAPMMY